MTTSSHSSQKTVHPVSLSRIMLMGAAIGFILMFLFIYGVQAKPEWSPYWKIRPLVVISFAGALGGFFYYQLDFLRVRGDWNILAANFVSPIIFLFGLWMGTVLGLNGTLWN